MNFLAGSSFLLVSIICSGAEQSLPQEQQVNLPKYFEDDLQPTYGDIVFSSIVSFGI